MRIKLFTILLTLLGFGNNGPKHDLRKQPNKEDNINKIRVWFQMNLDIIALAAVIGSIVFFVWFCFFISGISATESGMIYNNLDKVI